MSRCIHGFEESVYDVYESCPRCAEERRYQERQVKALEAQEDLQRKTLEAQLQHQKEALESQQRRDQLLAETRQAQQQAVDLQQAQLELQKRMSEEDKIHKQAEQERLELRTGLPEFSTEYQEFWLALASKQEELSSKMKIGELVHLQAKADQVVTENAIDSCWKLLYQETEQEFQKQLQGDIPRLRDPPALLDEASIRQQFDILLGQIRELNVAIRAIPPEVNPRGGPMVQLYREVALLSEKISSLAHSPPGGPVFAILSLAFFAFFGIIELLGMSDSPAKHFGTFLFFSVIALISFFFIKRRHAWLAAFDKSLGPVPDCLRSIASLFSKATLRHFERLPELEFIGVARAQRLKNLAELSGRVRQDLLTVLLDLYREENLGGHPTAKHLQELALELERNKEHVEEIAEARRLSEEEERTLINYNIVRNEIRRVGRLILDGLRVAGRQLELTRCPSCGVPASSETVQCSECGTSLAQHGFLAGGQK